MRSGQRAVEFARECQKQALLHRGRRVHPHMAAPKVALVEALEAVRPDAQSDRSLEHSASLVGLAKTKDWRGHCI